MRTRTWLAGLLVAASALVAGVATAAPAHADVWTGQFAYDTSPWSLINAWGGGPWVNVYKGGTPTSTNDNFSFFQQSPTVYYSLKFIGGGAWNGRCIGDANNDPGDARASLDACGTGGIGEGWGVNFTTGTSGCPSGWRWFRNVHWPGYLGPADGAVNGSHFYLNKPTKWCFDQLGPA